ncbi:hypothetical protein AB5I41_04730 [Sphingomonas sp. MMS24-JH45]
MERRATGYTLTEDPALPPQSFSRLEIEALMLGVASLGDFGDDALATAGRSALARIVAATLPDRQARQAAHATMRSWRPAESRAAITIDLDLLREARRTSSASASPIATRTGGGPNARSCRSACPTARGR